MKLSKKALKKIDAADTRLKLALAMGFSETWIRKCIKKNKENGPLTTISALRIIQRETGLNESEVLTESVEVG